MAITSNVYMVSQAVEANENWNKYLENLSPDELEKMRARDWFLKKHGRFFGSGILLAERIELNMYNTKTDKEKESVLTQYRWTIEKQSTFRK